MQRFEYRNVIAEFRQIARASQSGRTGSDHGNLVSILLLGGIRLDLMLSRPIRYKTFQFSDGNRLSLDSSDAFAFALTLLRAYAAANRWKRAGFADNFRRPFKLSFIHLLNEGGNVNQNGTTLDALRVFTVETSGRFRFGLLLLIAQTDLLEIGRSDFRILLSDRYFSHHIHY